MRRAYKSETPDFGFVTEDIVDSFVNDNLYNVRYGYESIKANCPFCGNTKGKWNISLLTGLWHCYRCKASGNFNNLVYRLRGASYLDTINEELAFKVSIPSLDNLLAPPKKESVVDTSLESISGIIGIHTRHPIVTRAVAYLQSRRIDVELASTLGVRVGVAGKYKNRILVPFVENNKTRGFVARAITDIVPRYMYSTEKGLNANRKTVLYKPLGLDTARALPYIVVSEGVFDAIALQTTCNMDTVAVLTNAISSKQILKIAALTTRVIVVLDGGFLNDAVKLGVKIAPFVDTVEVAVLPEGKDPNDLGEEAKKYVLEARDISYFM